MIPLTKRLKIAYPITKTMKERGYLLAEYDQNLEGQRMERLFLKFRRMPIRNFPDAFSELEAVVPIIIETCGRFGLGVMQMNPHIYETPDGDGLTMDLTITLREL